MRTPVPSDVIEQLREQFAYRVAKFHSNPTGLILSFTEMENLCSAFPNTLLLEAFRRTGSFTLKNPRADHESIFRVIKSIANKLLVESHSLGKHSQYKGLGLVQVATTPTTKTTTEEDINEVQRVFSVEIGEKTLETFTLHPEEASALLAQHSLSELTGTCETVGRWVWSERTDKLRFHDQDTIVAELFRRARVPQPEVTQ